MEQVYARFSCRDVYVRKLHLRFDEKTKNLLTVSSYAAALNALNDFLVNAHHNYAYNSSTTAVTMSRSKGIKTLEKAIMNIVFVTDKYDVSSYKKAGTFLSVPALFSLAGLPTVQRPCHTKKRRVQPQNSWTKIFFYRKGTGDGEKWSLPIPEIFVLFQLLIPWLIRKRASKLL